MTAPAQDYRAIELADSLFAVTDGKFGETLATAVLAYLLRTSAEAAQVFCQLVSQKVGRAISAHVSTVLVEQQTVDDQKRGRIDLIVDTTSCRIGIEAKLWHTLAADQPTKYLSTLGTGAVDHVAVVLVPRQTATKCLKVLNAQKLGSHRACLLQWQELSAALIDAPLDSEARLISKNLEMYIEHYVGALDRSAPFFNEMFIEEGNAERRAQYIRALLPEFALAGGSFRGSSSVNWSGYTFLKTSSNLEAWYGVVRSSSITPFVSTVLNSHWTFVVAVSRSIIDSTNKSPSDGLIPLKSVDRWNANWNIWKVDISPSTFTSHEYWQSTLAPLLRAAEAAISVNDRVTRQYPVS